MNTFRPGRPSPALVVSIIALFAALTGTSYAAFTLPTNSVGIKQLKNGAVSGPKIQASAITGAKVADHSLTGADILLSSLGKVPSASNSDRLGGATPAAFQRSVLQAGHTEAGVFTAYGTGPGYMGTSVTYPIPLPTGLDASHVVMNQDASTSTNCPGTGQAARGYLCVYESSHGNAEFGFIDDPSVPGGRGGSSTIGITMYWVLPATGGAWSYGTWAVTAP
jgi:hypothetical protein